MYFFEFFSISVMLSLSEHNGRWLASLHREAVRRMEDRFGEDVSHGWTEAWILHVGGFHERRLSKEDITKNCNLTQI
jgi:hypothetical protein